MKTAEVNQSLVGKRVRITEGLYKGEGTIVATVEGKTKNHPKVCRKVSVASLSATMQTASKKRTAISSHC